MRLRGEKYLAAGLGGNLGVRHTVLVPHRLAVRPIGVDVPCLGQCVHSPGQEFVTVLKEGRSGEQVVMRQLAGKRLAGLRVKDPRPVVHARERDTIATWTE